MHIFTPEMKSLFALCAIIMPISECVSCESESGENGKKEDMLKRKVGIATMLLDHVKNRAAGEHKTELGQEVGVGLILGVSSGFAVKKAARTLLFTVRPKRLFFISRAKSSLNYELPHKHSNFRNATQTARTTTTTCATHHQTGVFFAGIQVLRARGWIQFDWDRIESDLTDRVDFDEERDARVASLDDGEREALLFLESGLPCGSAFGAGFLIGLRL